VITSFFCFTNSSLYTELFVFNSDSGKSIVLNIANYYPPDIVYISNSTTTCSNSKSCISYFTHDSYNNSVQLIFDINTDNLTSSLNLDYGTVITADVLEVKTLKDNSEDVPLVAQQWCCAGNSDACICGESDEYCKEFIHEFTVPVQNITTNYVCVSCSNDPSQCNEEGSFFL